MPDNDMKNETPRTGETPEPGDDSWLDEYEAAVRTPEDVRRFQETMEEEKQARIREIIQERRLARLIRMSYPREEKK